MLLCPDKMKMFSTIEVQPFVTFAVDSINNRRGTLFCRLWIKTWEIKVFLIQQTPGKQGMLNC
uniref:Uncharacterized protein n=1 Tax=Solanum tuberosum TaxID=4113 RepID=M1BMD0_SOLTU